MELAIPILIFGIPFGLLVVVPVVAILTEHQRKMAELLNGRSSQDQSAILDELRALRQEVSELKALDEARIRAEAELDLATRVRTS